MDQIRTFQKNLPDFFQLFPDFFVEFPDFPRLSLTFPDHLEKDMFSSDFPWPYKPCTAANSLLHM